MTKVFVELLTKVKELETELNKHVEAMQSLYEPVTVPFRLVRKEARQPEKHLQATAYDLFLPEDVTIYPWTRGKLIPTGVAINFPEGVAAKTWARSSTNKNTGIRVNTGIIDNDYTGEIFINVDNINWWKWYKLKKGEKIAQLEIHANLDTKLEFTTEVKETERGAKGFGSSGK